MRSLLALAKEIDRQLWHKHSAECYGRYEACGEHHVHDDKCGSRSLLCRRAESLPVIDELHRHLYGETK